MRSIIFGALLLCLTCFGDVAFKQDRLLESVTSTATAAGTTTLIGTSDAYQQFTGVTTQTVVFPDATTLPNGWDVQILNRSSGAVTAQNDDTSLLKTVDAGSQVSFRLMDNSTSNGVWDIAASGLGTAGAFLRLDGTTTMLADIDAGVNGLRNVDEITSGASSPVAAPANDLFVFADDDLVLFSDDTVQLFSNWDSGVGPSSSLLLGTTQAQLSSATDVGVEINFGGSGLILDDVGNVTHQIEQSVAGNAQSMEIRGANQTLAAAVGDAGDLILSSGSAVGAGSTGDGGTLTIKAGTSVGGAGGIVYLRNVREITSDSTSTPEVPSVGDMFVYAEDDWEVFVEDRVQIHATWNGGSPQQFIHMGDDAGTPRFILTNITGGVEINPTVGIFLDDVGNVTHQHDKTDAGNALLMTIRGADQEFAGASGDAGSLTLSGGNAIGAGSTGDGADLILHGGSSVGGAIGTVFISDGVLRMDEITTPANPAAGSNNLYFKPDDELYKLNSAGVEVQITGLAAGEANTASNVNVGGVGVFKQKTVVDLEFRGVNAASSKVTVALDGANNEIDIDVSEASIDHDALLNFVANEHIDHSAVTLTAGDGLSGGGDITASRTFDVDINSEASVAAAATDEILIADASDTFNIKKVTAQSIADLFPNHAANHIDGGSDPVDGNKIEISWVPLEYVRDSSPAEVDSLDDLTAHLKGIDNILTQIVGDAIFTDTIQTVGAGFNTIRTLTAGVDFVDDDTVGVSMDCVAMQSDGTAGMGMHERQVFRKDGAAATVQVGGGTTVYKHANDNTWSIAATLSGSDILLQVRGNTGDTVMWKCRDTIIIQNAI